MSTPKTTAPKYYKFTELVIDPILSGRSEKEIRDNAKSLAPEMAAAGGWDAMQPGQVATSKDGKPRVVAGFTRIAASQLNGEKGGYFFEIEDASELDLRLKCISTNGGKPVGRIAQGDLFSKLVAGVVADDFAGAVADPKKPGDWKIQPMSDSDIAKAIGKSAEHVRQCMSIHEFPESAELIETDAIGYNVAVQSLGIAKGDHGKAMRIIRAAMKEANGEKATKKHVDAVKAQFIELKAVSKKDKEKEEDDEKDEKKENKGDTGHREQSEREASGEPRELDLGDPSPSKPPTPKQAEGIRAQLVATITKFNSEKGTGQMDKAEIDNLADWLVLAGFIVAEMPF